MRWFNPSGHARFTTPKNAKKLHLYLYYLVPSFSKLGGSITIKPASTLQIFHSAISYMKPSWYPWRDGELHSRHISYGERECTGRSSVVENVVLVVCSFDLIRLFSCAICWQKSWWFLERPYRGRLFGWAMIYVCIYISKFVYIRIETFVSSYFNDRSAVVSCVRNFVSWWFGLELCFDFSISRTWDHQWVGVRTNRTLQKYTWKYLLKNGFAYLRNSHNDSSEITESKERF